LRQSIRNNQSGLSNAPWPECDVQTWLGRIPDDVIATADIGAEWQSRNNQLALLGLYQDGFMQQLQNAVRMHGAERIGIVLGTSTSSIGRTEEAFAQLTDTGHFAPEFNQPQIHNPHSTGLFLAQHLGIKGPAATISTACSSSAKAFATAKRWIDAGLVDAVLVGGVDSLCLSVIYGFNSLQLVADEPCRPFDKNRTGISLGEAAGYAIVSKTPEGETPVALLGYGESTDAWHMSTPHPEGLGAQLSMQQALTMAGLSANQLDYINLHGTGTRANDDIEGLACNTLLAANAVGKGPLMSATKGLMGHTLGAAGIAEAILAMESIVNSCIPGTINTVQPEPAVAAHLVLKSLQLEAGAVKTALTNSFGFGGNNCSLIFGAQA
jgi:3-oxoacyl-[acyl-carrier-protein] synthase-1